MASRDRDADRLAPHVPGLARGIAARNRQLSIGSCPADLSDALREAGLVSRVVAAHQLAEPWLAALLQEGARVLAGAEVSKYALIVKSAGLAP